MAGRYAICLVCAHVLLIIWGYALTSNAPLTGETADLVLHYPEMLKATAGFLLLVVTGIVSARAVRRTVLRLAGGTAVLH